MDTPPLKDGNRRELRHLHDVLQQHLRALKSMKTEPDPSFITSLIELKLDPTTLFEWQKHSHENVDNVHNILEFLDLRARASESLAATPKKQSFPPSKKASSSGKVTSFVASNLESNRNNCTSTPEQHPLYACSVQLRPGHQKSAQRCLVVV